MSSVDDFIGAERVLAISSRCHIRYSDDRFVVERREAHALEVTTVALLATHHDPHGGPLRYEHGLNHPGNFVDERDGARDVVQHFALANLLPGHGHVLE